MNRMKGANLALFAIILAVIVILGIALVRVYTTF